jgi:hypothetical protein
MKNLLSAVFAVALLIYSPGSAAQEINIIGEPPVIIISDETKSGSALISLRNGTGQRAEILLTSGKYGR